VWDYFGDAKAAWRRAHDIFDGMVRQGMTVSPQDMQFLETLRAKVKEVERVAPRAFPA
jgi:hypothetical protein